jgi:hypothetical protein
LLTAFTALLVAASLFFADIVPAGCPQHIIEYDDRDLVADHHAVLLSDETATYTYLPSDERATSTTGFAVTTYSYDSAGTLRHDVVAATSDWALPTAQNASP